MNKIIFKKITIFFIAAILCFSFGGCRRKEDKKEIYFLNFKPEIADAYDKIANEYEKLTGVRVKVSTAAANTYEQTLKSEIAKKDAPTIFQINGPIGYQSWKNYCADLKDTKLYSILSDKSLAVKGEGGGVYGIPYAIEGYGIICNTEIFDEYFALTDRQTTVNSFDEITSFVSLKTVVEDMTLHKTELSIDGVFASTSLLSGEDWRWQTHLANIPFHIEVAENGYDIGSGVEEFKFTHNQYMKNLFDLYISNSVTEKTLLGSKSVADSMAEFALGRCAMVQNGNWAWAQIKNVPSNKVNEQSIRFLPLYTGSPIDEDLGLCIGTENYFCINANASDEMKKLADDFLYWLFSSETGKSFVTKDLDFITPFKTFTEKQTPNDPLAREINRWLKKENVESVPWSFVAFPSTDFKNDFGSALLSYAQNKTSWDDVVRTVTERWKEEAKRGR